MPKIPIIKTKDFINYLVKYGCNILSVRGSHHKVFYPATGATSVIALHSGEDLKKGSFSGILKQLDIDIDDFLDFIS